jgi:hypothetical protein
MKVLLDNCLDVRLKAMLSEHEVVHARDMGWRDLENGRLLAAATGFDVMSMADTNIRHQQHLNKLGISIVEIDVFRNTRGEIEPLRESILLALERAAQWRCVVVRRTGGLEMIAPREG